MTMSRIVVTGGSGKAGRATVDRLQAAGFDVVNVDISASLHPDEPTLVADLSDYGQTIEALSGADAVVHLAAVPAPNILTQSETFRINTMSTYNVFAACAQLGVERVVWASSETLIGIPLQDQPPQFAPIDETHPRLPEFHYALSKLVGEEMASQFSRWHGISFVGLRISNIMLEEDYRNRFPGFWDDPTIRAWNLWGYVDHRDVALACHQALLADVEGSEEFLIAAADTCMTTPSADLLATVYPGVPVRRPIEGHETLIAIDKARSLLGYVPEHSWRDHIGPP